MSVQDDARENELIALFRLRKADTSRGGVDAVLDLPDGTSVPFELKSTTTGNVTTVRDFGSDHIEKWSGKHWLIGLYSPVGGAQTLTGSLYASPAQMRDWIEEKRLYIEPDFRLAELAPTYLTLDDLNEVLDLGDQDSYSLRDAYRLHKRQYTRAEYREAADLAGERFSPEAMLDILRARCAYLIARGSTLNNPHIPASYFRDFERISANHAARLRSLVSDYLTEGHV